MGCANKSKQKEEVVPETSINNTVEKNDTLGLLLDNQQEEAVVKKESDKKKQTSETISFELKPIPRDIPIGEAINPDSLSMLAEYDYYPLSTTKIKVIPVG